MFRTKDSRRFKTPSNQPSLLHEGEVTSDPATIQSCWSNHFKTLFQTQIGSCSSLVDTQNALPHLEFLSKMNFDDIIDDNFSVEEIEVSIRKLKTDKAGGIDRLQSEHLKYGGPLLTLWLKQIFCAFTQLEQVPPSLLTGMICPIYKGKGKDPLSCHSYRGITITSVLMKVFEYTILNRLLPALQKFGHPSRSTFHAKMPSLPHRRPYSTTLEMVESPTSLYMIWRKLLTLSNTASYFNHSLRPASMAKCGDSSKPATAT